MHITQIKVNGFKSLVDFEMDLGKFTCLIGLNGSGKSTVLQFIDFLSQLIRGDIDGWLEERQWDKSDISSKSFLQKQTVDFTVKVQTRNNHTLEWEARYNIPEQKCTYETFTNKIITSSGDTCSTVLFKTKSQKMHLLEGATEKITFRYNGSILSQIAQDILPEELRTFSSFFRNVNSFDMLAPQSLRRRDRKSGGSIGLSGQRLSAFLYELGSKRREELGRKLKKAYPQLGFVAARSIKAGWKQMLIMEEYGDRMFFTEARHVNDGMLRLIAILAELESEHEFLLFDEIENGINPELVEFLIEILTETQKQIMVTTHSPMILNYLNDETAQESVVYLYKTEEGKTRSVKYFDIPSLKEKLEVMGPGEAFVDTNLVELADEIHTLFAETV